MSDSETDTDTEEQQQPEEQTSTRTKTKNDDDDDSISTQKKFVYVLSILGLFGGIGLGIYYFVIKGKEQIDENNGNETQENNSFLVPGIAIALLLLGAGGLAYFYVRRRSRKKTRGSKTSPSKTTKTALARKAKREEKANNSAEDAVKALDKITATGENAETGNGEKKRTFWETLQSLKARRTNAPDGRRKTLATVYGFDNIFANANSKNHEVTEASARFKMNLGDFSRLCSFGLPELKTLDLKSSLLFVTDEVKTNNYLGTNFSGVVNKNKLKQRTKEKQTEVIQDESKTPNFQMAMFKYRAYLFNIANAQLEEVLNNEHAGATVLLKVLKNLYKIQPVTDEVKAKINTIADGLQSYSDMARIKLKELEIIEKKSYGLGKIFGPSKDGVIVSVPTKEEVKIEPSAYKDADVQNQLLLRDHETFMFTSIEDAEAAAYGNEDLVRALDEWEDAKDEYEEEVAQYKLNLEKISNDIDTDLETLEVEVQMDSAVQTFMRRLSGLTDFAEEEAISNLEKFNIPGMMARQQALINDLMSTLEHNDNESSNSDEHPEPKNI